MTRIRSASDTAVLFHAPDRVELHLVPEGEIISAATEVLVLPRVPGTRKEIDPNVILLRSLAHTWEAAQRAFKQAGVSTDPTPPEAA